MRIVYLHRLHLNGSGQTIQVLRDYHALARRGHDVHLLYRATRPLAREDLPPLLARYGLPPLVNFNLHWIAEGARGRARAAGMAGQLARAAGQPVVFVARTLEHAAQALNLRRDGGIVLLELHETAIPHMVYAEQGRRWRSWWSRLRERRVLGAVDGIICTVGSQAALLDQLFPEHAPHSVLPNGVDLGAFSGLAPKPPRTASQPFRLRYAGQFTAWKNTDILFAALRALPDSVTLELAGGAAGAEAETRAMLEASAARHGVAHRLRYAGFLAPRDVPAFLRAADALALPLGNNVQSRYFTSPMKLFEYAASGVPMVVTRQPTTESLVEDGKQALLVAPESPSALATAVEALLHDPALGARLADTARAWVGQYAYDERARRYEEFMARRIAASRSSGGRSRVEHEATGG